MLLLDVPPEVFQRVISTYVYTVGIRKAAKVRETCSECNQQPTFFSTLTSPATFNAYINDEMFARQPVNKFNARVPRKLLAKNQVLFLESRSKALYDAPDVLPAIVRKIAKVFMNLSGEISDSARMMHIRSISSTIVAECSETVSLLIAPTARMRKDFAQDSDIQNALAISIMQRKTGLVSALLQKGASPWGKISLMGRPLQLAVKSQKFEIMAKVLSEMEKHDGGYTKKIRSSVIVEAIDEALQLEDSLTPGHLLQWHVKHLKKPSVLQCGQLFSNAVSKGALSFLGNMLDLGFAGALRNTYVGNVVNAFGHNKKAAEILSLAIDKKLVTDMTRHRNRADDEARGLLDWAIEANNVNLVKIVLRINVWAHYEMGSSATLRKAIENNNPSILRILLKRHFDPEGGTNPKDKSTMDLARKDSAVYHMLREAIVKTINKAGGSYKAPKRYVWNAKKQKDELVAYSFTAPEL